MKGGQNKTAAKRFPIRKLIERFSEFENFLKYLRAKADKYVGVCQAIDYPLSLWALNLAIDLIKENNLTDMYFSEIKHHLNFLIDGQVILLLKTKIKLPGNHEYLYKRISFYPRAVAKWVFDVDAALYNISPWRDLTGNDLLELIDPVLKEYTKLSNNLKIMYAAAKSKSANDEAIQ
jgi:hypothetical protein